MKKTVELLDKCKKKLNISSTYELSEITGISEQALSNYYLNKSNPDEYVCFKIAEVLELDPAYVIAQIKSESEKNDKKREYFRSFGGSSRKIAASIATLALLGAISLGGLGLGIGESLKNAISVFLRRWNFA